MVKEIRKVKKIASEISVQFWEKTITFMTAALGFVAALFWQNAIKDTISAFIPPSGAWQYEILVAVAVTFLAVVTLYMLTGIMVKEGKKEEKGAKK